MKLLFSTIVLASGAAMAGAATLPVIAAMCCLLRKRMGARRALDARYARGEINREEYAGRRKRSLVQLNTLIAPLQEGPPVATGSS